MILNPTHEITLSGLPSEILDAYVRYKKGSRAIVTWLVQYGSASYKGVRTLPIKELAALAERVSSKIQQVPEVIHFHFKETIAARRCLSRFFRSNIDASEEEFDTVNHEHFTNSLCEIYSDLCERCRAADAQRQARRAERASKTLSQSLRNHYDCLPVEDAIDIVEMLQESSIECNECSENVQTVCHGRGNDLQIEDDVMSAAIETLMLLEKARVVYATTIECWRQAAHGKACFIAAAAATNVAWTQLRDIESQLKEIDPDTSLTGLHRRCCLFVDQGAVTNSNTPKSQGHSLLIELESSERTLRHHLNGHRSQVMSSCASCIQKPADYMSSVHTSSQNQLPRFQAAVLDNMLQLISQAKCAPALVFKCTPCFAEVGYLMSHLNDGANILQCTLALHLLTKSYVAYHESLSVPSSISLCRISALKLAKQGASAITAVLSDKPAFPCQCPQTLAYHLSNLSHDLESYAKHKRWDLYFQSPWVAGNHIIEMLDMLSYYGMRLFHYRHFVGAVLHTYNILRQLGQLDSIPTFEEISHTFRDILFPGGNRPTSHFKNSWARFIGARLRFKKGHKGHNHRESWCMAIPAHEARNAAGLSTDQAHNRSDPKFDYGRLDQLIKLKQQDYHIQEPNLSPETSQKKKQSTEILSPSPSRIQSPLLSSFQNLNTCLTPTPNHALPSTLINLLTLFHKSQLIISRITTKTHTEPDETQIHNCICFVTTLINGADRVVSGRKAGKLECWNKSERELLEVVKGVMVEVMGATKEGEMIWDF